MTINLAQFQAVTEELTAGLTKADKKLGELRTAADGAGGEWYVPEHVAAAAKVTGHKIADVGQKIVDKVKEAMEGVAAPVMFFAYASDWQSDVRGPASTVAGNTAAEALNTLTVWKGEAAEAYAAAVKDQPTAAEQIATSADKIAIALTWCAVSGAAFYVALGIVVAQLIASLIAAIVAIGSLVFSWAGVLAVLGEVTASSAAVYAAITALGAALATQAQQMATVEGEASDSTTFPNGHWPRGTA